MTSVASSLETGAFLVYCLINDTEQLKRSIKDVQEHIEDYSSNYAFDMFLEFADSCKNFPVGNR